MKAVIGLVGPKGSGKETCIHTIMGLVGGDRVLHIRFSDVLKETLDIWHVPATRAHLQKLAVVMEEGFGKGTLAHAIAERMRNSEKDLVLLEGIRWDADVDLLRSFPVDKLIYTTAEPLVRHERTRMRAQKVGEAETTFEQFIEEEKAPNEVHIVRIGEDADATIENNGSLAEFQQKVRDVCETMIIPLIGKRYEHGA